MTRCSDSSRRVTAGGSISLRTAPTSRTVCLKPNSSELNQLDACHRDGRCRHQHGYQCSTDVCRHTVPPQGLQGLQASDCSQRFDRRCDRHFQDLALVAVGIRHAQGIDDDLCTICRELHATRSHTLHLDQLRR